MERKSLGYVCFESAERGVSYVLLCTIIESDHTKGHLFTFSSLFFPFVIRVFYLLELQYYSPYEQKHSNHKHLNRNLLK